MSPRLAEHSRLDLNVGSEERKRGTLGKVWVFETSNPISDHVPPLARARLLILKQRTKYSNT